MRKLLRAIGEALLGWIILILCMFSVFVFFYSMFFYPIPWFISTLSGVFIVSVVERYKNA